MLRLLISVILVSTLFSCQNSTKKEVLKIEKQTVESLDTIINYWEIKTDTAIQIDTVRIGNDFYQLEIKTFSLNDSSIIRWNTLNKPTTYKDIYHSYATDLTLKKGKTIILKSKIDNETFKDSLDGDFLNHSILKEVSFDFVRSNRLYFKSKFNVPDTGWMFENQFAIFYKTNKKGQINFWGFKDIGN